MARLEGRFMEDVKDFVVDTIDRWLYNNSDDAEETIATAKSTLEKVEEGRMLYKDEAKWLDSMLSGHLHQGILQYAEYRTSDQSIRLVDTWGIYSDAWYLYCRPGTYTISF